MADRHCTSPRGRTFALSSDGEVCLVKTRIAGGEIAYDVTGEGEPSCSSTPSPWASSCGTRRPRRSAPAIAWCASTRAASAARPPATALLTMERIADDAAALLDHLGLEHAVVVRLLDGRLRRLRHGPAPPGARARPGAAGHARRGRQPGGAEEPGPPRREDAEGGSAGGRWTRSCPSCSARPRSRSGPRWWRAFARRSWPRRREGSRTPCRASAPAPIRLLPCARSACPPSWCAGRRTPHAPRGVGSDARGDRGKPARGDPEGRTPREPREPRGLQRGVARVPGRLPGSRGG